MQRVSGVIKMMIIALGLTLTLGCSGLQTQIDETRRIADQAAADAAAARTAADGANSSASEAKSMAGAAQRAADSAATAAAAAQTCCTDNSEKIDRMFKRSMSK